VSVSLRCPVRGCDRTLAREETRWRCDKGHSFDLHRTGSLNLLQPQDRRSKHPGDSREAAAARRRLSASGHGENVYRALLEIIRPGLRGGVALLDVGCGEGAFLRHLDGVAGLERHGVDISAPSVELASKASPLILFVVANADRALPYAERSFDFVTSIDARVNASEFERILKPGGLVIVAVPGADDLIELRERIKGEGVEKPRAARVEEDLKAFRLRERTAVRETRVFEPAALRDLLTATYRGFRQSERAAVESLHAMSVTLSHEVLTFERR
jgi:23S rRNA (guanine745-N1)-methyltransferase